MIRNSRPKPAATGCGVLTVTSGDGGGVEPEWEIHPPTTQETEPLPAGGAVDVQLQATNNEDTSETVIIDGEPRTGGTYEADVFVNGAVATTVTFKAAVDMTVTETVSLQVPEASEMTVDVAGAKSTFSVSGQQPGDLQFISTSLSTTQAKAGDTLGITAVIGCFGGPDNGPCADETFEVSVGNQVVKRETLGGWAIAAQQEVSASATLSQTGEVPVTITLGDETVTKSVTVAEGDGCPPEGCPEGETCQNGACVPVDGGGQPIEGSTALVALGVLGAGYYAYSEGML